MATPTWRLVKEKADAFLAAHMLHLQQGLQPMALEEATTETRGGDEVLTLAHNMVVVLETMLIKSALKTASSVQDALAVVLGPGVKGATQSVVSGGIDPSGSGVPAPVAQKR